MPRLEHLKHADLQLEINNGLTFLAYWFDYNARCVCIHIDNIPNSYILKDTRAALITDAADMVIEQGAEILDGNIPHHEQCRVCEKWFRQHRNETLCKQCYCEAHMSL